MNTLVWMRRKFLHLRTWSSRNYPCSLYQWVKYQVAWNEQRRYQIWKCSGPQKKTLPNIQLCRYNIGFSILFSIIRGDDHIANTPKQLMVWSAVGSSGFSRRPWLSTLRLVNYLNVVMLRYQLLKKDSKQPSLLFLVGTQSGEDEIFSRSG